MEITITPHYFLFGISWFEEDEDFHYSEVNLYFLCIQIKFMF